jgi:hypothetical protein
LGEEAYRFFALAFFVAVFLAFAGCFATGLDKLFAAFEGLALGGGG